MDATTLEQILGQLNVQPAAKEELLALAANTSRTDEETARFAELLDALESELQTSFGALAVEDAMEDRAQKTFDRINERFDNAVAIATKLVQQEERLAREEKQQQDIDEARKGLENA